MGQFPHSDILKEHDRSKWPEGLKNVALDKDYINTRYSPKQTPAQEQKPATEQKPVEHSEQKSPVDTACADKFQKFEKECENNFKQLFELMIKQKDELQRQVTELQQRLKELEARPAAAPKQSFAPQQETSSPSQESKPPLDKPIDRNNVAPSSVAIDKIFNYSNKKF